MRRSPALTSLLLLGFLFASATSGARGDEPTLEQLQQQEKEAVARRDQSKAALADVEKQLRTLEQTLSKLKIDLERNQATVTETEAAQKKQQEESTKAEAAKVESEKGAAAAAQALADAQKKAEEAKKAAEAARQAAEKAVATAAETDKKLAGLKETLAGLETGLKTSGESLTTTQAALAAASSASDTAYADWLTRAKAIEATLKKGGAWVSFVEEVAPVFQQRCVACHNSRMSKGRLNLETYAALMQGGESGPAVIAGDAAKSEVHSQVVDGAMPKDAAPLTAEQIAIVGKWISLGAKLDAGVDPAASLYKIIPKKAQPKAPDAYKVAPPVTAAAFSPDGSLIATSGYHEVFLWKAQDHSLVRRIGNVAERVFDISFHPDGSRLAIASGTPGSLGEVKVFQVADGALVADLVTVDDVMLGVAFSPDGARLAACGADRSVSVFDVATWKQQIRLEDHADWVLDINWSPDGAKLVTASRDKTSKVFDSKSGEAVSTFNGHAEVVFAAAFNNDGSQVVSAGRDKQLRAWTPADAKQARAIGGFGGDILALRILPENRVLTGGADMHVRLHQIADGKVLNDFTGAKDWVYCVDGHAGSKVAVSGSYDGELRLWNLGEGKPAGEWVAKP